MLEELKELWRFRELLLSMVQREIRVRYKNSFFGFLWSFVNPIVTMFVMRFVYGNILHVGGQSFSLYFLAAYLPFIFIQFSILDSSQSIITALPIVKKIYFPRELLPLASVLSNFVHLMAGMFVFFVFVVFTAVRTGDTGIFTPTVIYLPLLLVITLCLSTGLALLVSALNTFYEDVKYLVSVIMYLMFFLCPITYFVEKLENSGMNRAPYHLVYKLYNLNPFAALVIAFRKVLLPAYGGPGPDGKDYGAQALNWNYIGLVGLESLIVLYLGYALFNRMKWRFVERP